MEIKNDKQKETKKGIKNSRRRLVLSLLLLLILAGILRLIYQHLRQEWQKYEEMNTFEYQIK